jgi:predicted methyltransferase
MDHARKRVAESLIVLLSIPTLAWAQAADDSREKSEKVSEILAALQAEPGKRIADVGAGEGFYSLRTMACSCCAFGNTANQYFDEEKVANKLQHFRRKGPGPTTRALRDGLGSAGLRQGTLLDIGGGFGILRP